MMKNLSRRDFLANACKWTVVGLGSTALPAGMLSGCKTMDSLAKNGPTFNVGGININTASIAKTINAASKSFEDFTPEQEYYIGRTVGAMVLQKYGPYNNSSANRYINVVGKTLAQASDRPETYGGYHFLVQDSNEINAFAAPGGFVFVTRGLLRCCPNEDAVAAVLAHEIGHVQYKHGLQVIKKSRVTSAITTLAVEGTKTFADAELAQLTETFEDSIGDITQSLIVNGYSRAFERQADTAAVTTMKRVGYSPNGLLEMLNEMKYQLKPGGLDFSKTHPSPEDRVAYIQQTFGKFAKINAPQSRQNRFVAALRNV